MKYRWNLLLPLLLLSGLAAQTPGLYVIQGFSSHYELQNPHGFGFSLDIPLKNKNMAVNADWAFLTNQRTYYGYLLPAFTAAGTSQEKEHVHSFSFCRGYRLTVLVTLYRDLKQDFRSGLGLGYYSFSGYRLGLDSGGRVDLFSAQRYGMNLMLTYRRFALFETKFNFISSIRINSMLTPGAVATDVENVFGGDIPFVEFQVGLSYSL